MQRVDVATVGGDEPVLPVRCRIADVLHLLVRAEREEERRIALLGVVGRRWRPTARPRARRTLRPRPPGGRASAARSEGSPALADGGEASGAGADGEPEGGDADGGDGAEREPAAGHLRQRDGRRGVGRRGLVPRLHAATAAMRDRGDERQANAATRSMSPTGLSSHAVRPRRCREAARSPAQLTASSGPSDEAQPRPPRRLFHANALRPVRPCVASVFVARGCLPAAGTRTPCRPTGCRRPATRLIRRDRRLPGIPRGRRLPATRRRGRRLQRRCRRRLCPPAPARWPSPGRSRSSARTTCPAGRTTATCSTANARSPARRRRTASRRTRATSGSACRFRPPLTGFPARPSARAGPARA